MEFHLGQQTYSTGFCILKKTVHGMYDDFPVSLIYSIYGIIYPDYNLIIILK